MSEANIPAPADDAGQPDRLAQPVDAEQPPRLPFPVVGVGASAGGLEAFGEFLDAMRPDAGMAFVFVLHLPPDVESHLADILGRRTAMPVRQVEDGMPVEPDHVYVIRPGHVLTVRDGHLHLGPQLGAPRAANRPVDDFFKSLAEEQRERAICVVMSGMGSNGTAGAQAVKAVGGLCVAQDPESAPYPSMPRHLIDAGYADSIVRPAELPDVLLAYAGSPYARGGREADAADALQGEERHLREILAILRTRTKQDFAGYKKPTVLRRVQRRLGVTRAPDLAEYAKLLRQSPGEASALADDLLIHVTGFFRDPETWEALREKVVAPLVAARQPGAPVRAWVTACSSGEEAYSLAMLLAEEAERAGKRLDVKVFATDLAERALAHARGGLYPGGIESDVPPERLARFFVKDDEQYRVRQDLRDLVVFAPQNVLQDPPFSRLDIASCRNLLIYLEPDIQQRVLALLHFGLREGGALFLGSSETVAGAEELFEPVDRKARIFRRIGPTRHGAVEFPLPRAVPDPRPAAPTSRPDGHRPPVAELTRRTLLESHTPAAVTVDRDHRVLYHHGDTSPFLRQPHGEPTRDLLLLARDGVRAAARVALHRAAADGKPATAPDGWVEVAPDRRVRVRVAASPILDPAGAGAPPDYYVVSFEDRGEVARAAPAGGEGTADEVRRLQAELQGTIEELQTSNEELKASHEEALSVNEEMQSANEELETSKEEMQSLNEELRTVNGQLRAKMEEHQASASDLASLLSSTDIAVLFLDPQFRIRRFTPAVRDLVDLIPGDVGRPLAALARRFDDPDLDADCHAVLERLIPVAREVVAAGGGHYLRRVLPYRTTDNRIDGVVVTFVEITARKRAEEALAAEKEYAESIVETLHEPLLVLNPDLTVKGVNPAFYTHFRVNPAETVGRKVYHLGNGQWDIPALRALLENVLPDSNVFNDYEVTHDFEGLGRRVMLVNGRRLDHVQLVLLGIRDITERKRAEDALRASEEQFRRAIEDAPVPVIMQAEDGQVLQLSRTWTELTGYGLDDVPTAEAWLTRAYGPGADAVRGHLHDLFQGDRKSLGVEFTIRTRHGADRHWSFSASAPGTLRDGRRFLVGMAVDVTERRQAEEALRASQERLRLALQAARMGVWTLDPATGAQTRDANLNRLLGLDPVETTQPFAEFLSRIHPDDRAAVEAAFATSDREGRPLRLEFRVVWPDGSVRWLWDQGDVFGEGGGRPMLGACVDVTDRRAAEEAVRASEERLRLILESATDFAIFTLGPDRTVTLWSPGAASTFGYAEGEIVGRPGDVLFTPEDRGAGAPQAEAEQARREGRAADERWHLRKDGSRFFASGVLTPLGPGGFVKVLRDLTDRKRLEDALARDARILASVHDAVIVTDLGGVVTYWNEGATRLFGWAPEEMVGRPYADRFPEPERSWIAAEIVRRAAGSEWSGEYEDYRKDGSRVWIDSRVARFEGPGGQVTGILGVSRDITHRKEADAALRRARDELEARVAERTAELRHTQEQALRAERLAAIGQTVTALAHEGRNALQRAVGTLARLGMRLEGRADELDLLGRSRQALDDLEHLFDDVRTYAAPIQLDPRPCDVAALWREVWEQVAGQHPGRDVRLEERPGAPDTACEADPFRVRQVFTNLFSNALEACPDPVRVAVACREVTLGGRPALEVTVRDNGPGLTEEQRRRALEPFFTTKAKGTGLGLAIARRILEAHGGGIAINGGAGGAEITLTLPRKQEEAGGT